MELRRPTNLFMRAYQSLVSALQLKKMDIKYLHLKHGFEAWNGKVKKKETNQQKPVQVQLALFLDGPLEEI